jgi:ribosomal protein S18 acetylase RimI-like enzyme
MGKLQEGRFRIGPARSAEDIREVTRLFEAYAASLNVDLCFQDFPAELASLPGKYAPPKGELLLARNREGAAVGCVALRPVEPQGCCEIKRLYVSPIGRGLGLGRALAEAIIGGAERIGYREIRLDTLPDMDKAIALYRALGFRPIAPYYDNPVTGTLFLSRPLRGPGFRAGSPDRP